MKRKEFFDALTALEELKGIKKETFIEILESALAIAYKRNYGEASNVSVKLLPESNKIEVNAVKTIVETVENPDTEITLADAKERSKGKRRGYKVGDTYKEEIKPREDFGRIAAMTAKQVVMQRLRDVERNMVLADFENKLNTMLTTIVRRVDNNVVYVDLSVAHLDGVMAQSDQIPREKYKVGQKIRVFVKEVKTGTKASQIRVSRSDPGFVKALFALEVPEIADGAVEIKSIAREAGYRTKMAVNANDKNVDPVGACVGNRGVRINAVVAELNGEKIDIIPYSDDPLDYIARSLSPATVNEVMLDVEAREATVIVPKDKLSLAIGKEGQNVRLAARLTGYKIDVYAEGQEDEARDHKKLAKEKKAAVSAMLDGVEETGTLPDFAAVADLADLSDLSDLSDLANLAGLDEDSK
ncbi:MAG: transcription termination factor NusA [Firmicutes bacterium]|nr:transcription termination factor NusA [Bacillota bacterium]